MRPATPGMGALVPVCVAGIPATDTVAASSAPAVLPSLMLPTTRPPGCGVTQEPPTRTSDSSQSEPKVVVAVLAA